MLSTHRGTEGSLFSNVVSFSDGPSYDLSVNSTGIPYMFLTTMDESARDLRSDARASLTVSEKTSDRMGRCGALDAQEPPCSRITFMGRVVRVVEEREAEFAKDALFSKHPAMKRWPQGHGFEFYKFVIEEIFYLKEYGGAPKVSVKEYLKFRFKPDQAVRLRASSEEASSVVFEEE